MGLYIMGDLHLSLGINKPMDIFGKAWYKHEDKIKKNWISAINEEDMMLIAGDISWGMNMEEAKPDLDFINGLPGKKVMLSGNHDYWWSSVSKLKYAYPKIHFLKNDFVFYEDTAVCGTRGWLCPGNVNYTAQDDKLYKREIIRLELSIDSAVKAGANNIIVMMHFPPTSEISEESGFINIFKKHGINEVYYGHLHGYVAENASLKGNLDDINYSLISADYLNFVPLKIR